jgi:hypothetical protein
MRGLRFSHILARGDAGVFVQGSPECTPEDIRFDDVTVTLAKTTDAATRLDVRPPDSQGVAEHVEIAGFHLADVRDVTLRDCTVRWAPNPSANYGPALRTERVVELRNEGFRGTAAPRL